MIKNIELDQKVIDLIEKEAKANKRSVKAQIEHMVNVASLSIILDKIRKS